MTCFSHSGKLQLLSPSVVKLAKWSESSLFHLPEDAPEHPRRCCLHQQSVHLSLGAEKELRLSWHQTCNLGDKAFQNKDKAGQM